MHLLAAQPFLCFTIITRSTEHYYRTTLHELKPSLTPVTAPPPPTAVCGVRFAAEVPYYCNWGQPCELGGAARLLEASSRKLSAELMKCPAWRLIITP